MLLLKRVTDELCCLNYLASHTDDYPIGLANSERSFEVEVEI